MAIKIYNNKVMIGNYSFEESSDGLRFDGVLQAARFVKEGSFQGRVAGFVGGGWNGPTTIVNVIDRFPFASDSNAVDQGDLTIGRYGSAGVSSDSYGYTAGGFAGGGYGGAVNAIDKFPFMTVSNAFDVGDLSEVKYTSGGNSSKTAASGFASGSISPAVTNIINRIPFVTDTNAFDVGDLSQSRAMMAAQSSETHAYNSGGETTNGGSGVNTIDKFPMAGAGYVLATDVGDLSQSRTRVAGQSSSTHGYSSGGASSWPPGGPYLATIDKFPFASDTNASSVGSLTAARTFGAGSSSTTHGYTSGGAPTSSAGATTIDKFPFASDTSASSVGSITSARGYNAGFQI